MEPDLTFAWGECAVSTLAVLGPDGEDLWPIAGAIMPPVTYGSAPREIKEVRAPAELDAGMPYRVTVFLYARGQASAEFELP